MTSTEPTREQVAEKRVAALQRLKRDIPVYMGNDPKARHYQWLHDALDAAIAALTPADAPKVDDSGLVERLRAIAVNFLAMLDAHCENTKEYLDSDDQAMVDAWKQELAQLSAAPSSGEVERLREAGTVLTTWIDGYSTPAEKRDRHPELDAALRVFRRQALSPPAQEEQS